MSQSQFDDVLSKMSYKGPKKSINKKYFDTNSLEDFAFAEGVDYKLDNVIMKDNELIFNLGHLAIQGICLRVKDHPETGIPNKNFEI